MPDSSNAVYASTPTVREKLLHPAGGKWAETIIDSQLELVEPLLRMSGSSLAEAAKFSFGYRLLNKKFAGSCELLSGTVHAASSVKRLNDVCLEVNGADGIDLALADADNSTDTEPPGASASQEGGQRPKPDIRLNFTARVGPMTCVYNSAVSWSSRVYRIVFVATSAGVDIPVDMWYRGDDTFFTVDDLAAEVSVAQPQVRVLGVCCVKHRLLRGATGRVAKFAEKEFEAAAVPAFLPHFKRIFETEVDIQKWVLEYI